MMRHRSKTESMPGYSSGKRNEARGSVTRVVIASASSPLDVRAQHVSPADRWSTSPGQYPGHLTLPPTRPRDDGHLGRRPPNAAAMLPVSGDNQRKVAARQDLSVTAAEVMTWKQQHHHQRRVDHVDEWQRAAALLTSSVVQRQQINGGHLSHHDNRLAWWSGQSQGVATESGLSQVQHRQQLQRFRTVTAPNTTQVAPPNISSIATAAEKSPAVTTDVRLRSTAMPRCVVLPNINGRSYGFTLREVAHGEDSAKTSKLHAATQRLEQIKPNSLAQKAGLQRGDYVLAVNGVNVSSAMHDDVADLIKRTGEFLSLTVISSHSTHNQHHAPAINGSSREKTSENQGGHHHDRHHRRHHHHQQQQQQLNGSTPHTGEVHSQRAISNGQTDSAPRTAQSLHRTEISDNHNRTITTAPDASTSLTVSSPVSSISAIKQFETSGPAVANSVQPAALNASLHCVADHAPTADGGRQVRAPAPIAVIQLSSHSADDKVVYRFRPLDGGQGLPQGGQDTSRHTRR